MKTALVTGASGKIGASTVKRFLSEGYFVIGQYNQGVERIESLKSELAESGLDQTFFAVQCDLSNLNSVNEFIKTVNANFKHIDVLVANAGVDLYKLSTETTLEDWDYVFNVNVKSAHALCKAFLPAMIERKRGKIIFVSSIWGQVGGSMETCYSATKSAVIGYAKALAKEVGLSGINVNCVCPGVIDTPMNDRFTAQEKVDLISATPLGRMGTPQDVSELIYFLCSENANFITGQAITVDGGFTL